MNKLRIIIICLVAAALSVVLLVILNNSKLISEKVILVDSDHYNNNTINRFFSEHGYEFENGLWKSQRGLRVSVRSDKHDEVYSAIKIKFYVSRASMITSYEDHLKNADRLVRSIKSDFGN